MKKELDIFLTGLMFFTRLPVPKHIHHGADLLQKSARYFPWIGILVGAAAGGVYLAAARFFSPAVAVFLSMLASIFITGAFHEDGFADVCDGFGGGWTKEKILSIMKDSRLGTYGVIGLFGILGLKYLLLLDLSSKFIGWQFLAVSIAGHSLSRLAGVSLLQQYSYVSDTDTSKSKPLADRKLSHIEFSVALAGGLLPLLFLPLSFYPVVLPVALVRIYLGYYFNKWIGGYTGDCLGAAQQVTEAVYYLFLSALWKFT